MEEEFLKVFFDRAEEDAKKEIMEKGVLSRENALSLLMKTIFNHVSGLDIRLDGLEKRIEKIETNMATKDDIANMATKDDIANMAAKDDINKLHYWLMFGVGLISLIIILSQLFLK